MRSTRSAPEPDELVRPAVATPADRAPVRDRLGFYRLLASFPALGSYRAKLFAVALACFALSAFVLVLALVLGAGRLSLLAVLALVVVLASLGAAACLWAIGRLLEPLDLACAAIDDLALGRTRPRVDLPGSDAAAQVLRGVQALAARVAAQEAEAREGRDRDPLTGLWTRAAGRERAQALIDRETRRGREIRVLIADIDAFAAVNAAQGTGHGDALLKTVAARLSRVAGSDGIAARWSGDAFLLVQAGAPGEWDDARDIVARPIVVKGSAEPLTLSLGIAHATQRAAIDKLCAEAEAALAAGSG